MNHFNQSIARSAATKVGSLFCANFSRMNPSCTFNSPFLSDLMTQLYISRLDCLNVLLFKYLEVTVSSILISSFLAHLIYETLFQFSASLPPTIFQNFNATSITLSPCLVGKGLKNAFIYQALFPYYYNVILSKTVQLSARIFE